MAFIIWLIFICTLNWLIKRILNVSFWSAFTDSNRISQRSGVLYLMGFVMVAFLTFFIFVI